MEIQKRQMEEIQNKASGLFHTLFTKPQDFGKQLGSTVKEAVLKPITEGLGDLVAKAIQPLVSGIGGIFSGIFGGGKQDPMKVATDVNTAVTAQNSVAIASLTALMAAVMGMGAPAIAAPSGVPGGISLPAISIPAPTGGVSGDVGAGAPISVPVAPGAAGAPSAGATPADILNLPAMHAGASMNPLGMILGANQRGGTSGIYSMFTKAGFSKMLSNLKGTVWNQQAWDASGGGFGGGVQAIAKSPAAGAAGMMLAMNGLFGGSRGTWGGIAQSTAGGALIGEQIGGPLGAAIGAGAGFLAGLGEKLFRRGVTGERGETPGQAALLDQHRQLDGAADRRDRPAEVRRPREHRRSRSGRPQDADALLGGNGAEDAALGHDAAVGEPCGDGRQAVPAGDVRERHALSVPEQPARTGRVRHRHVPESRPDDASSQRPGPGRRAVRGRPGRDAGVCAGPVVERGGRQQRAVAEFGGDTTTGVGDA